MKKLKAIRRQLHKPLGRLLLAALVFVAVLVLLTVVTTDPPLQDKVVTETLEWPSETPVATTYRVAADQPLSITIPSTETFGYIQKVGVDQHQAVTAPNNVSLAGWFVDSVRPGDKGLSIIDGHVRGRSKAGVFERLSDVKEGDDITITYGNGSEKRFVVFATKTVPEPEAASHLFEQRPDITSQLNLITCTGRYDAGSRTYADRVIVMAQLAE